MQKLKNIKKNAVHKSMMKVFKDKRVLFIENDFGLYDSVGNMGIWCRENRIKHNCIFDAENVPVGYIIAQVQRFDIICFQTTWGSEVSAKLHKLISSMKDKKVIVECIIHEPTWFHKPDVVHDIYIADCGDDDMDEWGFKMLREDKAYWED